MKTQTPKPTPPPTKRKYGWRPELPDQRDFPYTAVLNVPLNVVHPRRIDMREDLPPAWDQGMIGSCVGHAVAGMVSYLMKRQNRNVFTAPPSRYFIYYNARKLQGWEDEDTGCYIRDAFKTLRSEGVCSEKDWEHNPRQVTWPPTPPCYKDAEGEQSLVYGRVKNQIHDMMLTILENRFPIVGGITVYESFESSEVAATGMVPLPRPTERVLGGHAILIVGYDLQKKRYLVRNSWGEGWGQAGHCWIPFSYIENTNLADDFWVVTRVE